MAGLGWFTKEIQYLREKELNTYGQQLCAELNGRFEMFKRSVKIDHPQYWREKQDRRIVGHLEIDPDLR